MKNKKLIYVLFPAVLAIWAIIFYRIFNVVGTDDQQLSFDSSQSVNEQGRSSLTDTFSIVADYRDPFSARAAVAHTERRGMPVTPPRQPEPKQLPVQAAWPQLSYSGMIKNQKSAVQLAMVQVNGQSYTLKAGESIEGVKVLKIFRDSVQLSFGKEKRTVMK